MHRLHLSFWRRPLPWARCRSEPDTVGGVPGAPSLEHRREEGSTYEKYVRISPRRSARDGASLATIVAIPCGNRSRPLAGYELRSKRPPGVAGKREKT